LYDGARTPVLGPVDYRYTWVDMHNVIVMPKYTGLNAPIQTCVAALGDSFAAGTTDGPGEFDFVQGSNSTKDNPYWNLVGKLLTNPTPEQIACQSPKPVLLNTGGSNFPTDWTASILPVQIVQLGQLFILAVPAEFTTMSGRRLRETVYNTIVSNGGPTNAVVVIAGLSNAYSQYVTTPEEYATQRYEGASTLFGPYTLSAYLQLFDNLTHALLKNQPVSPGVEPVDFTNRAIDLQPPVAFDDGPIGTVQTPPLSSYKIGDKVTVVFFAGDPRNDYMTQDTFLSVERLVSDNTWNIVAVDGHWETKFYWTRILNWELEESYATIEWEIPANTIPGTYRIRHFGYQKSILGTISHYVGESPQFKVLQ